MLLEITVVVIVCPDALGLATPMVIVVASGKGAQKGHSIQGCDGTRRSRENSNDHLRQNRHIDCRSTAGDGTGAGQNICLRQRKAPYRERVAAGGGLGQTVQRAPTGASRDRESKSVKSNAQRADELRVNPGHGARASVDGRGSSWAIRS